VKRLRLGTRRRQRRETRHFVAADIWTKTDAELRRSLRFRLSAAF
jgi:hypothetical protein